VITTDADPLRRLRVAFLPHPVRDDMFEPWGSDVFAAIGDRHDVEMYDLTKPADIQLSGVDVVIDHGGQFRTRDMADAAGDVKLWQVLGTGFDHFDTGYWRSRGIPVANTPGTFSATALAEGALMLMLMLSRRYPVAQAQFRAGDFYTLLGAELQGRTLALVGFGASAQQLALRARAMGMRIRTVEVREVTPEERERYGLEWVGGPHDLDLMVADADFVSLHLHLNPETQHIIDARRLSLFAPTAYLINVARGALVDEHALEDAVVSGRIAGAGLDVFGDEPPELSRPLFNHPNVICTPHVIGATDGTSRHRAACAAENVDRIARGMEPMYVVN
jgi:phosphoglycerate dehydrogenase-like enzyme